MPLGVFKLWLAHNQAYLGALKTARLHENGFYFELIEQSCPVCWQQYLIIGGLFHDLVVSKSKKITGAIRAEAIELSERHDHVLHNAAVLHLEATQDATKAYKNHDHKRLPTITVHLHDDWKLGPARSLAPAPSEPVDDRQPRTASSIAALRPDYELKLQELWLRSVYAISQNISKERWDALVLYGMKHTRLGKVIARRETQFHADGRIRTHPGFWGLFLIGSCSTKDKGPYGLPDNDEELAWVRYLTGQQLWTEGDQKYQIHERVPRPFMDSRRVKPGVYFHRSKAHGRDEFLVTATGKDHERTTMVFCTKGVGADFDVLPQSTAGNKHPAFRQHWQTGDKLPFSYSANQGGWATLGFCMVEGDVGGQRETEIATVDFGHFEAMYQHVKDMAPKYCGIWPAVLDGYVEPYVCTQLTCLSHVRDKILPEVLNAVTAGTISFPVQVSTGSPRETSLRMFKQGGEQDYDYNCTDIELEEWQRCFGHYPLGPDIEGLIQHDLKIFDVWFATIVENYRLATGSSTSPGDFFDQFAKDFLTKRNYFQRRIGLVYRLAAGIFASYVAFLTKGWGTDTHTGSFAGRNFGSGPRDANQWGPIFRIMDQMESNCYGVDAQDFIKTIPEDIYRCLGLAVRNVAPDVLDQEEKLYPRCFPFIVALEGLNQLVSTARNSIECFQRLGDSDKKAAGWDTANKPARARKQMAKAMNDECDRLDKNFARFQAYFLDVNWDRPDLSAILTWLKDPSSLSLTQTAFSWNMEKKCVVSGVNKRVMNTPAILPPSFAKILKPLKDVSQ